ncbi:beta-galactosidase [Oligosphaera ethanolica]|uniref:Glycoside hydrolase family 42 N-terminal domain-containing protein n=1 Tax=Oligosphaera ethanolica TaxID=760260 RepID=A0AAE4AMN6_9BACT|nr:beta-galactosidase [Oligosphaera ethanolica]MDQ0288686.1 hypothetical protein [Oligosphaera ethanolica]
MTPMFRPIHAWLSAIMLAAGAHAATTNFWPNPSFEQWAGETGHARFYATKVAVAQSSAAAHSGEHSLHLVDDDSGKSNSTFHFSPLNQLRDDMAGRVVFMSAWCKLVSMSENAQVGVAITWTDGADTWHNRYQFMELADQGGDWRQLQVRAELPADLKLLRFELWCSNKWYHKGEAFFDDVAVGFDSPANPAATTTAATGAGDRPLGMESLPPQDDATLAMRKEYEQPVIFREDGHVRPDIRQGTWFMNGRPEFFFGGWLYSSQTTFDRDWPRANPNRQGIDHIAYYQPPSKIVADAVGINSFQIAMEKKPANALFGLNVKGPAESEKDVREFYTGMKDLPLTMEFTFAQYEVQRQLPDLAAAIKQQFAMWHSFIPFCPEHPAGDHYYRSLFRGGALAALKNQANVFCWELFNESSYCCECNYNRQAFAKAMQEKFGSIAEANRVWGTIFKSFAEVAAVTGYRQFPRIWPDWCHFSAQRYADILRLYSNYIRQFDQRDKVYFAEQMTLNHLWTARGAGMDYRQILPAIDVISVEGGPCRYGEQSDPPEAKDGMEEIVVSHRKAFMLGAAIIAGMNKDQKPVTNHESYCMRYEGGVRVPSRRSDMISTLWLNLVNGMSTVYCYSWDKRSHEWKDLASAEKSAQSAGYKNSILLNPYNWPPSELVAFDLFRKELDPLKELALPFPRSKPATVAIFHSYPTLYLDGVGSREPVGHFGKKLNAWFEVLKENHYPLAVVFDEDLSAGLPASVEALVIPCATYATAESVAAIERFRQRGGRIIADSNALMFDERGTPFAPRANDGITRIDAGKIAGRAQLIQALAGVKRYATLTPALSNCHLELIDRGDRKLLFLMNMADRETRWCDLRLNLPDNGEFYVFDYVNQRLFANASKDSWTMAELAKGIRLPIPSQERMLLMLQREKPAGCELLRPADLPAMAASIAAAEAPELAKIQALRETAERQELADRRYDGVVAANCRPLNLRGIANMAFKDDIAGDELGGWFDQGSSNDFAAMPIGKHTLAGVPFDIIDPASNNGKGALLLYGKGRPYFPKSATGVSVGGKVTALYFLHCIAWPGGDDTVVLKYVAHFADGSSSEIPIRQAVEIQDWHRKKVPRNAKIALETSNSDVNVQLFCYKWANPHPDKELVSLDVLSTETGSVPAVVAITAEQ